MNGTWRFGTRLACAVAVAWIGAAVSSATSIVPDSPPDLEIVLPSGVACPNFDLKYEVWSNSARVTREFYDQNGALVRLLGAGKGDVLRFTNLSTAQSLATKANGSVSRIIFNADGSYTQEITGHNVLILFPTDFPAGPTTTLYVGRVVFTVDLSGVFRLQSVSATSTDICAAVS